MRRSSAASSRRSGAAQRNPRPIELDALEPRRILVRSRCRRLRSTRSTTMSSCWRSTKTGIATRSTFRSPMRPSRKSAASFMSTSARRCRRRCASTAGVNYEFSQLKVRGDAIADRAFKFLKPNLTLDWKPGGGWHTQLSVKRTVAQLDFYDFISFGELSTEPGQRRQRQPRAAAGVGIPPDRRASVPR